MDDGCHLGIEFIANTPSTNGFKNMLQDDGFNVVWH